MSFCSTGIAFVIIIIIITITIGLQIGILRGTDCRLQSLQNSRLQPIRSQSSAQLINTADQYYNLSQSSAFVGLTSIALFILSLHETIATSICDSPLKLKSTRPT